MFSVDRGGKKIKDKTIEKTSTNKPRIENLIKEQARIRESRKRQMALFSNVNL